MKRLTQDELAEPDVIFSIAHSREHLVPRCAWEILDLFIGRDTGTAYVYTLPGYRSREILQMCEDAQRPPAPAAHLEAQYEARNGREVEE